MTALDLLRLDGYLVQEPKDVRSHEEIRLRSADYSYEMSTSDIDSSSQVRLSQKYSKRPQYIRKKQDITSREKIASPESV